MYRTSATDYVPPLVPASMAGGGKTNSKSLRGGGRLGVSYLPERPVGGMLGRMPYGPQCIPVFHSSQLLYNGMAQGGGGSGSAKEKEDCGCESKERHEEWLYKLIEKPNPHMKTKKGEQRGGAMVTQFSGVSYVNQNLFSKMFIPQLIPIIVLAFAHSYILQYGSKKQSSKKGFALRGGGENAFDKEAKMRDFAQILQPLGRTNLQTLASILTMHYFSVRHLKEKLPRPVLQEGIHKTEMKLKEALGDHKTYQELEKVFLSKSSEDPSGMKGGSKGEKKLRSLIKPIGKTGFLANGVLAKLKRLFQNYHHVAHDASKEKIQRYQKKTFMSFKSLFDTLSPISVGMKIASEKR